MVSEKDRNFVSEEIVKDILKKQNKNKKIVQNSKIKGKIGDFQVGKKIIEVKGIESDFGGNQEFDYVTSYFEISPKEWEFIEKYPENFELWAVYRLDRKMAEGWPVSYTILDGKALKKCRHELSKIRVYTPKNIWKKFKTNPVPKEIWNKHKNKKSKKNVRRN